MKKVIYIDYILRPGHVNFNRIHIDALRETGCNVRLVLYKSIKEELPYNDSDYDFIIPNCLGMKEGHRFFNRIAFLVVLFLIKLKVSLFQYDYVYVANFDEITMGIFPLCRNMLLVAHANGMGLKNRIKRPFLKKLARHNTFLVFNECLASAFRAGGINSLRIISHGCVDIVSPPKECFPSLHLEKYALVVFHASPKICTEFITKIIENAEVIKTLEKYNILLILRNLKDHPVSSGRHVVSINKYLTKEEYNFLMSRSDAILIAYGEQFKNQVSGVSFESVSLGKNLMVLENPFLYYCRDYYNYDPLFQDSASFICLLKLLLEKECKCVVSPKDLRPDYGFLNC